MGLGYRVNESDATGARSGAATVRVVSEQCVSQFGNCAHSWWSHQTKKINKTLQACVLSYTHHK